MRKNKNRVLDHRFYTFAYLPGKSLMHKLNPLSKIFFLILLTISIFMIRSLILLTIIFILIILLTLISKISLRDLLRKLKFIIFILIISVILNIFFNAIPSNQETVLFYIFNAPFLPVRRLALYYALKASLIVLILFTSTIIFSNSTSPKDFLYSLIRIKIPYRYCFSLMVGIRYIPLIEQEAKTIALAQRARGFGLEKANSIKKAYRLIFERLVATLISILRKGHITSISMENRCFGAHKKRTNLKIIKFRSIDGVFIILCLLGFSFLLIFLFQILPIPKLPSLYHLFLSIF
ncbi:MAG: energy-coupling factor transporter transmembrane component T family protein [Promethearchaeota archaeon]